MLVQCLKANSKIFAWSAVDMLGMDLLVIFHKLNKKRKFALEVVETIRQEVAKLLSVGFIREVEYPYLVSNVVMANKANEKWRICIDFTNLNKACPKDSFPLPSIVCLVDASASHKFMNFMDEKIAFIIEEGLFYNRIGLELEVYVDDMLMKSGSMEEHVKNLLDGSPHEAET
ncbi:Transposon Ty3-I Gag-Pol polyprotein [Gossypium australe]|uniref:Transposon Ty3-I Gag-Pol polyprotein n=1 Tax=Gossypium australe TaxID=47621 RepID=A0A5B6WJC7_9ROSI|nr:Transposon Ty3-I Gag-Pol polyprotein [Gossypium australe]